MFVYVAVLKETQPHERRVALVPSVAARLTKLGAKLHMQSGAGVESKFADSSFEGVAFVDDRHNLVADADVVLAVNPPAADVVEAMKEGAVLISFIYAGKEHSLVRRLLQKKITCFAMERIPRITRAQSMDALSSQSALAGYYAVENWGHTSFPSAAQDYNRRWSDWASQGAGHGTRRRRLGGRGNRSPSGSCSRRLCVPPMQQSRSHRSVTFVETGSMPAVKAVMLAN